MFFAAALLLAQNAPCPALATGTLGPFAAWHVEYDSLQVGTARTLIAGDSARLPSLPENHRTGNAALVAFHIPAAGVYDIAIDQPGTMDLFTGFAGVTPLEPVSRREGEACSPIRQIVRFDLRPGIYRLYLSGLARDAVRVMLVAAE